MIHTCSLQAQLNDWKYTALKLCMTRSLPQPRISLSLRQTRYTNQYVIKKKRESVRETEWRREIRVFVCVMEEVNTFNGNMCFIHSKRKILFDATAYGTGIQVTMMHNILRGYKDMCNRKCLLKIVWITIS